MSESRRLQCELEFEYLLDDEHEGLARDLEHAQQQCQGLAWEPLHWGTDGQMWVARDQATGIVYRVRQLPF